MRKSIGSERLAVLEGGVLPDLRLRSDAPSIIVGHGPAGNDATCEDPAVPADNIESWARRVLAANGYAGVGSANAALTWRLTAYVLHRAARVARSLLLGDVIVAAIRGAIAHARRVNERYEQRRQAWATYEALSQLDNRTLRDLGLDRSEIRWVAAELTERAEYTRIHALRAPPVLPGVRRA